MSNCDCCRESKKQVSKRKANYQKLVEVSRPAEVPLIGSSSVTEYRITSDMRHKPADIAGIQYVQNFSAMHHHDRLRWLERRNEESSPWTTNGNFQEIRSDHLHHFGLTSFDLKDEPNILDFTSPPCHESDPTIVGLVYINNVKATVLPYRQYQSILVRSRQQDKGKKEQCSALAATRGGVLHVLHMPCTKYGRSEELKSKTRGHDCIGKKIVVCVPCDKGKPKCCNKDIPYEDVKVILPEDKPTYKSEPVVKDYMYRCESRELLGSKLLKYCECVKRNGLQDRCPRTPCLGRSACLEKPWPNCWPSGGTNGIDYSRNIGLKRINPALEYRRDNKKSLSPHEETPQLVIQECCQ